MGFAKMRLSAKMLFNISVVLFFFLAFGVFCYVQLSRQSGMMGEMNQRFGRYQACADLMRELSNTHLDLYKALSWVYAGYDEKKIETLAQSQLTSVDEFMRAVAAQLALEPAESEAGVLFAEIGALADTYKQWVAQTVEMLSVDAATATMQIGSAEDAFQEMNAKLKALINLQNEISDETYASAQRISAGILKILWPILIGVIIISVTTSIMLTRNIIKPLKNVFKGLRTFSTQELEQTGELLNSAIQEINDAARQVESISHQQAQGASEQAAGIEETSASLEQMSAMTKQNADNAGQANRLMDAANAVVKESMQAMDRMTVEINKMRESANQTAKIIKTIDEIAFQTNLLALNAAVEAARAGEAGKGFAVVAEEVRNLARRSAEAARTTAELIEGSQKNSESGVNVTLEMAKSMQATSENAGKVATLITEIAAASKEQSQGIDQINVAVSEMDKVVQQNAAAAEESAGAARQLNDQVRGICGILGQEMAESAPMMSASAAKLPRRQDGPATSSRPPKRAAALPPGAGAKKDTRRPPAPEKAVGAKRGASKAASPEEVIPLDESDFKDF